MTYKFFEIRDAATMIPALGFTTNAMDEDEAGWFLLRHSGFSVVSNCIFLVKLQTGGAEYDPFSWTDGGKSISRTMSVAHQYIENHWQELKSGDVVDVEHIMGLTPAPKTSERLDPHPP